MSDQIEMRRKVHWKERNKLIDSIYIMLVGMDENDARDVIEGVSDRIDDNLILAPQEGYQAGDNDHT